MRKEARTLSAEETPDLTRLENIWYEGFENEDQDRHSHYNKSRYYALNLHSVFYRGTVEWRCFNSTLDPAKAAAYVHLCLAMSAQAIVQRSAVMQKTRSDNELFTFRVWLVRLGGHGEAQIHIGRRLGGVQGRVEAPPFDGASVENRMKIQGVVTGFIIVVPAGDRKSTRLNSSHA